MKSLFYVLSVGCMFALGCVASAEWPRLRSYADPVLGPVSQFLTAPELAAMRLQEIRSLEAREQQLAGDLARAQQERTEALQEAKRATERYAALCHAIRSLEVSPAALPALVQE